MLGTTFRLNTATTNSATKSQRPSARFRCAVSLLARISSGRKRLLNARPSPRAVLSAPRQAPARLQRTLRDDGRYPHPYAPRIPSTAHPTSTAAHHSAIRHCKPVVTPDLTVDLEPIAIIANRLGEEHQRAIRTGARQIGIDRKSVV